MVASCRVPFFVLLPVAAKHLIRFPDKSLRFVDALTESVLARLHFSRVTFSALGAVF